MNGHSEPGGKFHPHGESKGIHSSTINHSTELNSGFQQRGSKKTLQHESREISIHDKAEMNWNKLSEGERFDIIHEKFYNSNLPNINDLSEKKFSDLPEDVQRKITPSLMRVK